MALALEAFCLIKSANVVRQKEEAPKVILLTNEAIYMLRQHQDSLLPAARQGEGSYEIAANCCDLVLINRLFNAINTHLFITRIAVRNSL